MEVFLMFKLNKLAFSEKWRNIITGIIYLTFVFYSIYLIVTTPTFGAKIIYACIMVLFLTICLLSEYLRYLYRLSIKSVGLECNPIEARLINKRILKFDIFKSYANTLKIMETLLLIDENKPEECLNFLEENSKLFKQNLDFLLVRNYTSFKCYFLLGNKTKVKKLYPEITKLRGAKIKGSKISPLYSWDEIDAIYHLACNDLKKSRHAFETAHLENMNHRELAHFYYEFAQLCILEGNTNEANNHLEQVISLSNRMVINSLAQEHRKKLSYEKA